MEGSSKAYRRRSPPPGRSGANSSNTDSSTSAYGRPKTPKSSSTMLGNGMAGSGTLVDEPTSTISGGKSVADTEGFDVYPPQAGSSDAPGPGGGFAYSTTLRRQASSDFLAGRARSRSPVTYREHDYTAFGRGRSASLREAVLEEPESGVLGKVANGIRRAIGAEEVPYQRLATSSLNGEGVEGGGKGKETPSAVYAHKSIEETIKAFSTDPTNGLSNNQLPSLVSRYGLNEFEVPDSEPLALKFAKQVYENPLILLLLGSAVVSALLGSYDDAVCVVIAVTIVLTVGFVQEQRSEKSLEALNKLVPHYCNLIRNGQPLKPLANALLPGDLITFTVGDRVPADVRLLSAVGLEIDESALTGETKPAKKRTEQCGYVDTPAGREGEGASLGGRKCVAFMGTLVRSGHGTGIVVGTGTDSEFGSIFAMMQDVEEKRTPLQVAMDDLAKRLSIFSFAVIGVIFLIGVVQKRGWLEMFTIGVSLAVAAIPEGLPIVTTVTLALGVLRMSRRKAIVKKLPSVEALGSVSVICSDKTGTLTKNEMTVTHLYAVDDMIDLTPHLHRDAFAPKDPNHPPFTASPAMLKVAQVGALCNNAFKNDVGINVGQATEVALLNVLPIIEKEDDRKSFTRKSEVPFSSDRKVMSVIGSLNGGSDMVYLKGAPEAVLSRCRYFYVSDTSTPSLDTATQKLIMERALSVQKRGLRVIAMAYGFPGGAGSKKNVMGEDAEKDLIFVGFEAMLDPPRRGVAHAIAALQQASVQVVMITGDSEPTALAIARELGMKVSNPTADGSHSTSCLLGSQIDTMSERELIERVPHVTVYARTTPRHKMAIVKAWQMRGAVVAMTGDGVNDSPALKMADIGISMGKSGTDVAKEAADVILVDDDFSSILPAVEEGKSIFYNIQNFLSFQLSTAVAALGLITLSTFLELANPLNAMQILFINILMDGPPAQALGVDPVDKEIMRRPPRNKSDQIISRRLLGRVAFSASMIMLGTLWVYAVELSDGTMSRRDQTMTFTCFVFLDLVSAIQNRGLSCPLFRNRMLFLTISVSFITQLALVYVPLLQHVFQTEALGLRDLMTLLGLAATSMGAHEGRRWYERKLVQEEFGRTLSGGALV